MMYLSPGISQQVSCDGCMARCCAGEDCFVMNFTHSGSEKGYVALTPNFPMAKVVPVDLSSPSVNGVLIAQQGAFMASVGDVEIGISCDCNLLRCCCAGTGLVRAFYILFEIVVSLFLRFLTTIHVLTFYAQVRQKIEGNGLALIAANGTIIQKVLEAGETIIIDTNCVLAFAESCKLEVRRAAGIVGMVGGGEGIFNTTLTGPGLVLVQSMNEQTFKDALAAQKLYRR